MMNSTVGVTSDGVEKGSVSIDGLLNNILLPFTDNPAGSDPRYSDGFINIKIEVDKLCDSDFVLIKDLSEKILLNESKDLRVCGYYVLALSYLNGIEGLIEGLIIYSQVLNEYYSICFPDKRQAKLSAIRWVNNKKILSFVSSNSSEITSLNIERLENALTEFNSIVLEKTNDDEVLLSVFNDFVAAIKNKKLSNNNSSQNEFPLKNIDNYEESQYHEKIVIGDVLDDEVEKKSSVECDYDVLDSTRKICEFLLSEKEYVKSIRYSRACRWSCCNIPPHIDFKTQLNSPRQVNIHAIEKKFNNKEYESVIFDSENLFYEEGGNYFLTIQKYIYDSAVALHNMDLANEIIIQLRIFINGLGMDVLNLKFSNNLEFSDSMTTSWIINNMSNFKEESGYKNDSDLDSIISKAKQVSLSDDFFAGLDILDDYYCRTEKERIIIKHEKAKLCFDYNKINLALNLYRNVYVEICEKYLFLWDVKLAVSISLSYMNTITSMNWEDDSSNEKELIELITMNICKWDFNHAAILLENTNGIYYQGDLNG